MEMEMNNPIATSLRRPAPGGKRAAGASNYARIHPGVYGWPRSEAVDAESADAEAAAEHLRNHKVSDEEGKQTAKRGEATADEWQNPFETWKKDWEKDWGSMDEWAVEAGHVAKLAVLAPITTVNILGKVIYDAVQDEESTQRFDVDVE